MRVVYDLTQVRPAADSHVAVGVFDGVHRGHQRLIGSMIDAAHRQGRLAAVLTFEPHPLAALGRQLPPLLTTAEERGEAMAPLGLDVLLVPPFTAETTRVRAADFVGHLVKHVRMVELWAGPDFALGYRCEGTVPVLRQLGQSMGFSVRVVEPQMCGHGWINSSRVRTALQVGDVAWARRCLGRPYRLSGVASPGGALAGRIGGAALSLRPHAGRLVPAPGVYACLVQGGEAGPSAALVLIPEGEANCPDGPAVEVYPLEPGIAAAQASLALDFLSYLHVGLDTPDDHVLAALVRQDVERARAAAAAG